MKILSTIIYLLFFQSLLTWAQDPFIGKWNVTDHITIPAQGTFTYYYELVSDASINGTGAGTDVTIITLPSEFPTGEYVVSLTPSGEEPLHRIVFNNDLAHEPLNFKEIIQWGDIVWSSTEGMFWGCQNMTCSAIDNPILSSVTNMSSMFRGCTLFNYSIGTWDVSGVTDMSFLFDGALFFDQNLNSWDVSNVTDMRYTFSRTYFDQPLDTWDVSSVTTMEGMFHNAFMYNQPMNTWDVSNVVDMSYMFHQAYYFNHDISEWDVSQVTNMTSMFRRALAFNQNINSWDVGQVTSMVSMFYEATSYNQPLNEWNVSNVETMQSMFEKCSLFNQHLDAWDVGKVEYMTDMFNNASAFNGNISTWDVSQVVGMEGMFRNAIAFNQPLNNWDVSSVTSMAYMFSGAVNFNQPLDEWNTESLTHIPGMFSHTTIFNQNLESWDVSDVTVMSLMFYNAEGYNQPLNSWDVSSLRSMNSMFTNAYQFNQPLDNWDVKEVRFMQNAFQNATAFNQNLGAWKLDALIYSQEAFKGSGMDCANYSYTLMGWASYDGTAHNVIADEMHDGYYGAEAIDAHSNLISIRNWTLNGDDIDLYCITPCIDPTVEIIGTHTLQAIESGEDVTYQWIKCGEPISIIGPATTNTFTPYESGAYAVIITKGDCVDTSDCVMIELPSSVDLSNNSETISIAPNPAESIVYIQSAVVIHRIKVYDVTGRLIKEAQINKEAFELEIIEWPEGLYIINLIDDQGGEHQLKLLKE